MTPAEGNKKKSFFFYLVLPTHTQTHKQQTSDILFCPKTKKLYVSTWPDRRITTLVSFPLQTGIGHAAGSLRLDNSRRHNGYWDSGHKQKHQPDKSQQDITSARGKAHRK